MDALPATSPIGMFRRMEAISDGITDRQLHLMCRARELHRIHHGVYLPHDVWDQADDLGRHLLLAKAIEMTHGPEIALSHTSAALAHGLRLYKPDLSKVHISGAHAFHARRSRHVSYHDSPLTGEPIIGAHGLRVVDPVRAALETALVHDVRSGLVTLDSLLESGLGTREQMEAQYLKMAQWPGANHLQIAVRLAREGSGSVGESVCRFCFHRHGVPTPELQYPVFDQQGRLLGVSDFAWPKFGVLGEFDGRVKYDQLRRPGESPEDVVFREKQREDRMREATGWLMIRIVWADLHAPEQLAQRVLAQLDRGRRMRLAS